MHQPVTTTLADQYFGVGRVALNLLPKPVDMCFQGVGLDGGAVAPDHFLEHLPVDKPAAGTDEILQNRRLLVGEADLLVGLFI